MADISNNNNDEAPKKRDFNFASTDEKKKFAIFTKRVLQHPEFLEKGFSNKEDAADLIRYLRARDGDVEQAYKFWLEVMEWRKSYRPFEITEKDFPSEASGGKFVWLPSRDKKGNRIGIFYPGLHDPSTRILEETQKYILYSFEKAIESVDVNEEKYVTIIWDRTNFTRKNFDLELIKKTYKLLANYPELLANVLIINIDLLFWTLFQVTKPFLDDRLKKKVCMSPDNTFQAQKKFLLEHIDEDSLWDIYGGNLKYQPENPSPQLTKMLSDVEEKKNKAK